MIRKSSDTVICHLKEMLFEKLSSLVHSKVHNCWGSVMEVDGFH